MRPSFSLLWMAYPVESRPCDGPWENQCAIRLSIGLIGVGIDLSSYSDPVCKHGHARGAESLANYLWRTMFRPQVVVGSYEFHRRFDGRTGLVFFKDITGFRGGQGSH
jgi:hypothetical protein